MCFAGLCAFHIPSSSFFFTDPPPTEIYTLSLHDALPICLVGHPAERPGVGHAPGAEPVAALIRHRAKDASAMTDQRSEEHTSELQSRQYLVCRLLLEKKKKERFTKIVTKKHTDKHTMILH